MKRTTYDEFGRTRPLGTIGPCGRCGGWIRYEQAYCSMIPFVGSWGGFMHQYCPPRLVRDRGSS